MSGSHCHITYTQILERERRLQLSNILKFSLKLSSGEGPISLKNNLNTFVENVSDQDSNSDKLQYLFETLQFIPDIQISPT